MWNSQYWCSKRVQMVHCGMECVNLQTTSIKILRIHFSCNGKIENDENYSKYIIKIWYKYEKGGLKNVDIFSKTTNLQCSWIRRLYDASFYNWKEIPVFLVKNYLQKNFVFHSSLSIKQKIVKKLPNFYQ